MKYRITGSLMLMLGLAAGCNNAPETNATTKDSTGLTNKTADSAMKTPAPPMLMAVYNGHLPCADCMEIAVTLNIFSDSSFRKTSLYMGKSEDEFVDSGKWKLHRDTLSLNGEDGPMQYIKNDSGLVQLDITGHRITGTLADKYILKKTN